MSRPSTAASPPTTRSPVPGADVDPRFFATGVSLICHPVSPRIPAVHMNTRFIATTKHWFGGGGDLTPVLMADRRQDHPDTLAFHAAMKAACDAHDPDWHAKYKAWCDEYFYLPHRQEPRGTGGVFYDHHDSGDYDRDFAFNRDIGLAFLDVYPRIVAARIGRALDGGGARGTADPPRPICGVQPALRPGHHVRPEDRRKRGLHPVVHAPRGEMALARLQAGLGPGRVRHAPA